VIMTSRERVLAALRHEQPDRTPRDFWAELPAWQRLFAHVGHTDKDKLLDSLDVDVLDPIQPTCPEMQPESLKRSFGNRLSYHGGIDMQNLLPSATPARVAAEVRRYCEVLGRGGGYIFGPAHLFQPDVPPQNVLAVHQASP
jgi:uroporphyrinogen-III decarboxylase